MSQYPSDLSGGVGGSRSNRLRLTTDTGGGNQPRYSPQGLEPLPPTSTRTQIANELAQSLGLLANFAGSIELHQRRREAAIESENAKVEQFDRGAAVRAAANTYAEIEPAIRERQLIAAVDDKDLGSYVENLIASRTGRDQSPAWREEFSKQLHPRLLAAFGQQRAGIRKEAKETAIQSLKDRAFGARRTVEIMDAVNAAKNTLGLSDMEAHAAITVPAMRLAADQGDQDKFEQSFLVLPEGMFAEESARAETKLASTRQRNSLDRQQATETDFAAWFEKDPTNLPPYEVAIARLAETDMTPQARGMWRRRIEEERSQAISQERQTVEDMIGSALRSGDFDAAQKIIEGGSKFGDMWKNSADQWVATYQTKVIDNLSKEYESQWRAGVANEVLAVSLRASRDGTPGASSLPDKATVTLPNGRQAVASMKEILDSVRPQVFAAIDQEFSENPRRALAEKTRWLSANGVIAPEWKQAMDAGAAAATEDALTDPLRAQTAVGGFTLYREISAQSPSLARQMVGDDARKLYDTADGLLAGSRSVLNGQPVADDPARALFSAIKIVHDPNYARHEARADSLLDSARYGQDSALVAAAKEIGVPSPDLLDAMRREARPMMIGGKSAEDALETVVKRYKATTVTVGGKNNRRALNTRFEGFSDQFRSVLPAYSKAVLDQYHADEGNTQGYDREDLSLALDPRTLRFGIVGPDGLLVQTNKGLRSIMFDRFELEKAAESIIKDNIIRENEARKKSVDKPSNVRFQWRHETLR
jgi:hypothetical protein